MAERLRFLDGEMRLRFASVVHRHANIDAAQLGRIEADVELLGAFDGFRRDRDSERVDAGRRVRGLAQRLRADWLSRSTVGACQCAGTAHSSRCRLAVAGLIAAAAAESSSICDVHEVRHGVLRRCARCLEVLLIRRLYGGIGRSLRIVGRIVPAISALSAPFFLGIGSFGCRHVRTATPPASRLLLTSAAGRRLAKACCLEAAI